MHFTLLVAAAAASLLAADNSKSPATARPITTPLDYLPSLKGAYFPLQSKVVGHLYHVYVRLPQGYEAEPERRYPIVYLLDGDSLFPVIAPTHLYLTIDEKLPEAIIVGIAYGSFSKPINRRHIDFMPPGGETHVESGTAAFQSFLKTELLPAVEQQYRSDPSRRVLFGQSRAGAMVLYSAFAKPGVFWAYVAHNPSWEPGRGMFFGPAPISDRRDLQLVVAIGTNEFADRRQIAAAWFDHWQRRSNAAPWNVRRIDIPGGTHSAYIADGYRASIRWILTGQTESSIAP